MAKVYTAHEIRKTAEDMRWSGFITPSEMLFQAADLMEREERREKKYEYKVLYCECDGRVNESITRAEIAKLNALIKELADALEDSTCKVEDCSKYCGDDETTETCVGLSNRALIAKAREVISKMETTTKEEAK